jgi:methionyl-tRNA formyltransferase
MAELSIMILCGPSPRHIYVANRLTLAARPVAIVQETGTKWTLRKVVKTLKPGEFTRKAGRWLRDRRRYAGNKEAEYFFEDRPPIFIREELVTRVPYINHPKVTELARQRNPDVIAVFGTTLIKPPLLGQGRLGMVNLHGGLSPEYRGADCTFWALYNGEPEKVGCTLHYIDAGIDTGRLIAHVCPEVKPADDELTLFWRAVRDGAEVYAELLNHIACGEQFGQAQADPGRLYRVKDRLWRHERTLSNRLEKQPVVEKPIPPRVRWFTDQATSSPA